MERAISATGITIVNPKPALNGIKRVTLDLNSHQAAEKAKAHAVNQTIPKSLSADEEVRVVSLEEYAGAAQSLAEAFADDHVARYFVDTPDRAGWSQDDKWNLHVRILEYVTYAHLLKGLVTTVGPNYGAVALWMPPGKNMDDLLTICRSGMWRLNYQLSAEGKKRFFNEFLPLLHDTKASVMGPRDDDSWYLVYIGTRPSARGKGYAKKLIQHITRRADQEGRACYLESSNPSNPPIYRKYGFEERKTVHLQRAENNVQLDIMVREPRVITQEKAAKESTGDFAGRI